MFFDRSMGIAADFDIQKNVRTAGTEGMNRMSLRYCAFGIPEFKSSLFLLKEIVGKQNICYNLYIQDK